MKKIFCFFLINLTIFSAVLAQWQSANNGLHGGKVSALTVDPATNDLFAGTNGNGVYFSSNNGTTWTALNNGIQGIDLEIISLNICGNNIFAGSMYNLFVSSDKGNSWMVVNGFFGWTIETMATDGNSIFAGTHRGIYLSTNDGSDWVSVNSGLSDNQRNIREIVINGNKIFAGTADGIILSTDNGSTWTTKNSGLSGNSLDILTLAIYETNIFAGTSGGIYLSTNEGDSWTLINSGLPDNICAVSIAFNGNNVFAGTTGGGVFLSTNNGTNWTAVNNGLPYNGLFVTRIAIKGSSIFAGTKEGVFLSTDNGSNWTAVNSGILNRPVRFISFKGNDIVAGTPDGVYLSTNNGDYWTAINNGLTGDKLNINSLATSGNNIYAGTWTGLYLSANNGNSWTDINNGLNISAPILSLAADGTNTYVAIPRDYGFYMSTNNGSDWIPANTGFPYAQNVRDILIKGSSVFAATINNGIFKFDGSTWASVNNGLSGRSLQLTSIATNGIIIYAGTYNGVFLSTDNGDSWTAISNGLSGNAIYVYDIAAIGSYVFAATSDGIFLTTDSGYNWIGFSSGLPDEIFARSIYSLAVDESDIFFGAFNGVWHRSLSDIRNLTVSLNSINFDEIGSNTETFNIVSNTEWTVECSEPWITAIPNAGSGNATITLTAQGNLPQTAILTITGTEVMTKTISVTQNGGVITSRNETNKGSINIYPNPAKDFLIIDMKDYSNLQEYSIRIIDMMGTTVYENRSTQQKYQINSSSLPGKGVYFIQVYDSNNRIKQIKKIILD